ncbi:hypothetical protein HOLleu_01261 [Holothuria leucospilota]|uniref:Uncharacterized protein n=1 Tax=Holothuria leucospilota TaxID=206669 RepID=A0A9Q1HK57_HOLLE|nr:hypothetical protein HOLleu_01261 [Holothuria leucospilota]
MKLSRWKTQRSLKKAHVPPSITLYQFLAHHEDCQLCVGEVCDLMAIQKYFQGKGYYVQRHGELLIAVILDEKGRHVIKRLEVGKNVQCEINGKEITIPDGCQTPKEATGFVQVAKLCTGNVDFEKLAAERKDAGFKNVNWDVVARVEPFYFTDHTKVVGNTIRQYKM